MTPSETLEKIRRKFDGLGISLEDLTVEVKRRFLSDFIGLREFCRIQGQSLQGS